jgi:hypothetical protein
MLAHISLKQAINPILWHYYGYYFDTAPSKISHCACAVGADFLYSTKMGDAALAHADRMTVEYDSSENSSRDGASQTSLPGVKGDQICSDDDDNIFGGAASSSAVDTRVPPPARGEGSQLQRSRVVHAAMSAFLKIKELLTRHPALNFEILEDFPKVAYLQVFRGEEENQNF